MYWQGLRGAAPVRKGKAGDATRPFLFCADLKGSDMPSDKSLRPKRETAESKAETTKRISQEITQAETERREAKTARLRAARLALQENQPVAPAANKPGRRSSKTSTRPKT